MARMPKTPPPYIEWYPQDWLADLDLQRCSAAAKGVWIQMLMMMHQSDVPGVLWRDGQPMTDEQIAAKVSPNALDANLTALKELVLNDVARKYPVPHRFAGAYFSQRLILEIKKRNAKLAKNRLKVAGFRSKQKASDVTVTSGYVTVRNRKTDRLDRGDKTAAAACAAAVAEMPVAAPAAVIPPVPEGWIKAITKRPEWLPEGKPWIDRGGALRVAEAQGATQITQRDMDSVMRSARDSRNTLKNPAGWVLKQLLDLANQKGTHAPQSNHAAK